jgi:hypothetical protein
MFLARIDGFLETRNHLPRWYLPLWYLPLWFPALKATLIAALSYELLEAPWLLVERNAPYRQTRPF